MLGVPTDTAVSFRSGARFGPAGIRSASLLLRPYNPHLEVDVVDALSMVDSATCRPCPGNEERTASDRAAARAGASRPASTPLMLGGDHSIVLAELRAHAAVHGPLGARAPRRPRRHLGGVLRRALLPRHGVQARGRGGPRRPVALAPGGHARDAVRRLGPRRAAPTGLRDRDRGRAAQLDAGAVRRRASPRGSATAPRSCRSTSTSSTRRSRRGRARRRSAGRCRTRRSRTCAR